MEYKTFEHFVAADGTVCKTYGIAAVLDGEICESCPDVTLNKERAEELARLLNSCEVSLVHFLDIIEDFLCDN